MSYRLIKRSPAPHRFIETSHETFDDAVWAARDNADDYLIEREGAGVVPREVLKYRLGEFEMG